MRILSAILDEEALGRIEGSTDKELQLTNYEPMKDYILQQDAKLKSRTSTRHKPSGKDPDDMVYGVESKPRASEPPPSRAPAPQVEDPWLASAADTWASPPGLIPETPPDAAAWSPLEGAWMQVG